MAMLSSNPTQLLVQRTRPRAAAAAAHCIFPRAGCVQQRTRQLQTIFQAHEQHAGHRMGVAMAGTAGGASVAQQDVLVEEVMNPKPVLLQADMSIKDAVHTMLEANIAGAPVVDKSGKVVGVLTEADVIWKGVGKPEDHFIIPPTFIGALDAYVFLRDTKAFEADTHKVLARTVCDAMVGKDKVFTIKAGALMSEAAQIMVHNQINLLPVVEDDGTVVGIVTRHDLLRGIYASNNPLL